MEKKKFPRDRRGKSASHCILSMTQIPSDLLAYAFYVAVYSVDASPQFGDARSFCADAYIARDSCNCL